MATKHGNLVTYGDRNPPIESHEPGGDVWSHDKVKAQQILFGKTYRHETWQVEVNAPMMSYVPLTTWSHEVAWQTKNEIFLPSEDA